MSKLRGTILLLLDLDTHTHQRERDRESERERATQRERERERGSVPFFLQNIVQKQAPTNMHTTNELYF
jgi:hypothetical protein